MHDFELYQAILGLQAPWRVITVELNVQGCSQNTSCACPASSKPCGTASCRRCERPCAVSRIAVYRKPRDLAHTPAFTGGDLPLD